MKYTKSILRVINTTALIVLFVLISRDGYTQEEIVLVKVYDHKLEPFRNEELSVNGNSFIRVDKNRQLFTAFQTSDLPPRSVHLKNQLFEVATWSYSKGKIEIVIRPRTTRSIRVSVYDDHKIPVTNQRVKFAKKTEGTTNNAGIITMDIPVQSVVDAGQFELDGFTIASLESLSEGKYALNVRKTALPDESRAEIPDSSVPAASGFQKKGLEDLDSIQSFSELYALFKKIELRKIDKDVHQKINEKFLELISRTKTQPSGSRRYVQMISDTSRLKDDISNLLRQARSEHDHLSAQRKDFDLSAQMIQNKLARGVQGLDANERDGLINDLAALEGILSENEKFFSENHEYYTNLLALIRENFLDISVLEEKLSVSEFKRTEQERNFRQRIILVSSLVVLFGILVLLLLKSHKRLRQVNRRIREMNENLEDIVMRRTKMLTLANKELDTFLYRASHDLRSPVCSILGLCNIATQVANPESQDLLQKVSGTVMIMDKLLKKLSVISEINQPSGYGEVWIKESITNAIKSFERTISGNKVDVRVQCEDQLVIYSYPGLLDVVLNNIIENALFYSLIKNTDNAMIEIEARSQGDFVEIIIKDNGIGINNQVKSRLFEMFFKGNENSKGNGLGLYIVLKSIHALNGEVEVESEPGQYSKFIVTLPVNITAIEIPSHAVEHAIPE